MFGKQQPIAIFLTENSTSDQINSYKGVKHTDKWVYYSRMISDYD